MPVENGVDIPEQAIKILLNEHTACEKQISKRSRPDIANTSKIYIIIIFLF